MALVGIWSRISGAVAGVAIGRAATDAVTPVYENTRQQSWARRAVRVLDPEAAAEAQAQGIDFGVDYEDDAKRNGVGKNRFLTLVAMARTYPGVSELLALWRRDPTLEDEIRLALRRQGYTDAWIDRLERLRYGVSDPGTLAQLVAVGQLTDETGRNLANTAGVSDLAFDRMVVAARNAPNMGQILDWGNRQGLTDSEVADALEVTGLRPSWRAPVAALRHYLIPPSDLIRMAVREVFSPGLRAELTLDENFPQEFANQGRKIGMSEEQAKDYWAAHWDLPSRVEGAQMLFRGEISEQEYRDLLRALDYAPKWRGPLEAIARAIPTITDFQRMVRRGIYAGTERSEFQYDAEYPAEFTDKMALHGLAEADAKDLWAAGWRLPAAGQLYRMLWREQIDDAQLHKGLKALDYPIFWRDKLANIARPVPGRIDTRRMFAAGLIDRAQAITNYEHMGYTRQDAELLVQLAESAGSTTEKEASAADEATLYASGRTNRVDYVTRLQRLGYSAAESERKADVTDGRHVASAQTAAVNGLHTFYKKKAIDDATARTALIALRLPDWTADGILALWRVERDAPPPAPAVVTTPPPPPPVAPIVTPLPPEAM